MTLPSSPKMISVVMHVVIRGEFEQWLASRRLRLVRFPEEIQDKESGVEEYFVTFDPDLAEEVFGGQPET